MLHRHLAQTAIGSKTTNCGDYNLAERIYFIIKGIHCVYSCMCIANVVSAVYSRSQSVPSVLNPIRAGGGGLNQPELFSNIHFYMKKGVSRSWSVLG